MADVNQDVEFVESLHDLLAEVRQSPFISLCAAAADEIL